MGTQHPDVWQKRWSAVGCIFALVKHALCQRLLFGNGFDSMNISFRKIFRSLKINRREFLKDYRPKVLRCATASAPAIHLVSVVLSSQLVARRRTRPTNRS
jgi:hypothetical protein